MNPNLNLHDYSPTKNDLPRIVFVPRNWVYLCGLVRNAISFSQYEEVQRFDLLSHIAKNIDDRYEVLASFGTAIRSNRCNIVSAPWWKDWACVSCSEQSQHRLLVMMGYNPPVVFEVKQNIFSIIEDMGIENEVAITEILNPWRAPMYCHIWFKNEDDATLLRLALV